MKIEHVYYASFSPTGGTNRVARMMIRGLLKTWRPRGKVPPIDDIDLVPPESRAIRRRFGPGDVLFFAAPVFGGRLPLPLQSLPNFEGNGALAVPVVVFGNRAQEGALFELASELGRRGFVTAAGAAFIARHSIYPKLAQNRPDDRDEGEIHSFARRVIERIEAAGSAEDVRCAVPVAPLPPNQPGLFTPGIVHPERCGRCGRCVEHCPMDVIDPETFTVTKPEACIRCMACVSACPAGARQFGEPFRGMLMKKMEQIAAANAERKVPEIYV